MDDLTRGRLQLGGLAGGVGQDAASHPPLPTILTTPSLLAQIAHLLPFHMFSGQHHPPTPVDKLPPARSPLRLGGGLAGAGASPQDTGAAGRKPKRVNDTYRKDQVEKQKVRRAGASHLWAALDAAAPAAGDPPPWRQPGGKSSVNLPQIPPDSGGIFMGVD